MAVGDMIGMHMTLTTPLGSVSGDFLTPMPEYTNIMEIFLNKYLFSKENTDLIKIDIPFEFNYAAKSGNVFLFVYGQGLQGSDGSAYKSPFDLTMRPLEDNRAGYDLYPEFFIHPPEQENKTTVHTCGVQNWPAM